MVVGTGCDVKNGRFPCLNGGTCSLVGATGFECDCTSGFVGDECQTSEYAFI